MIKICNNGFQNSGPPLPEPRKWLLLLLFPEYAIRLSLLLLMEEETFDVTLMTGFWFARNLHPQIRTITFVFLVQVAGWKIRLER